MNKYGKRGFRRIEDALDVPTNMLIRVTAPLRAAQTPWLWREATEADLHGVQPRPPVAAGTLPSGA